VQTFPIPRSLNQDGIINRVILIRSILFLFLLLLLFSLWPTTWLLARDDRSEAHLGMWRIQSDEAFDIIYTHSVQLSPVTERYHINKSGELILDETLFSTYGAGLPATTPYDFEITEDSFRIFNIQLKMDHLVYRTGAVRANHRLLIRDQDIPFVTFSSPGQAVEFTSLRAPLLYYVIKEVIK
jgi:hypothetical protein